MKWSILATVLIILAGSLFSRQQQSEVRHLEQVVQVLTLEAEKLGTTAEILLSSDRIGHQREDRSERVRNLLGKLIDFSEKQKEMNGVPSPEVQEEMMQVMLELAELSAMDLKELVAQLQAREDLDNEMRTGMMSFCVMMLINDSPRSALELLAQAQNGFQKNNGMSGYMLLQALGKFAAEDPQAALAWMKDNEERFPDLAKQDQKMKIIQAVAGEDMVLALSMLGDFGLEVDGEDDSKVLQQLAGMARDEAGADAILASTRASEKDEKERTGLRGLANSPFFRDFDKATTWLEASKLTEAESANLAGNLHYYRVKEDTEKWLDWIGEKMPEQAQLTATKQLVGQWTRQDHRAAGEWLNAQEEGPTKYTAIESYAETLAPHDPIIAAEWVETLPAGKIRERTLKGVYRSWMKNDEAGAKDFADKHGLKE